MKQIMLPHDRRDMIGVWNGEGFVDSGGEMGRFLVLELAQTDKIRFWP